MTKLANVHIAHRLADARSKLEIQREHGRVVVMIDGQPQDGVMTTAARPAVVTELDRRIAEIDADLAAIGVEVA